MFVSSNIFLQSEERDLVEHCRLLSVRYSLMYITNNEVILDTWNRMLKFVDILLHESSSEYLHASFLHAIVRISYSQEPQMKVTRETFENLIYSDCCSSRLVKFSFVPFFIVFVKHVLKQTFISSC